MLSLKRLEVQNFKSYGEKKTVVVFDDYPGLTLFMGEDEDSLQPDKRNGCGKSSLLDALAFAFTGKPVKKNKSTNTLVNKHNGKKALVSLDFSFFGDECRIERGLKPGTLKFYQKKAGDPRPLMECDETRSTIAETQTYIESITKLDPNIVRIILISATKTPNFFDLEALDQKKIVETLFGFEGLTVKAAAIKITRQKSEVALQLENSRIQEREIARSRFVSQLEQVQNQSNQWTEEREGKIKALATQVALLKPIDKEAAYTQIEYFSNLNTKVSELRMDRMAKNNAVDAARNSVVEKERAITTHRLWLDKYDEASVEAFIAGHEAYTEAQAGVATIRAEISQQTPLINRLTADLDKVKKELHGISDNCPTCGQTWPDKSARDERIATLNMSKTSLEEEISNVRAMVTELESGISELNQIPRATHALFSTPDDAKKAKFEFESKTAAIAGIEEELVALRANVEELAIVAASSDQALQEAQQEWQNRNLTYETKDAVEHAVFQQQQLRDNLAALEASTNPHEATLTSLKSETMEAVDTTKRDALEDDIRHMLFMEKLLTKKDSPIRRIIITKWLPKLNELMNHYLSIFDLKYTVTFEDDLTATIKDFDIEMDFSDLSSGEEERVAMALSWAFRDVFENINYPINFIGIDERLDAGLDGAGGTAAIEILQEMAMNRDRKTFLVSHKKEMVDHVDRIVMVRKKGNFSRLELA